MEKNIFNLLPKVLASKKTALENPRQLLFQIKIEKVLSITKSSILNHKTPSKNSFQNIRIIALKYSIQLNRTMSWCDMNKKSLSIVVDVRRNEKGFRVFDVLWNCTAIFRPRTKHSKPNSVSVGWRKKTKPCERVRRTRRTSEKEWKLYNLKIFH